MKEFAAIEQILSFKSWPYLRKASLPRETKRKSQKLFSYL